MESDDSGKTKVNLKYGDKEEIKKEVIKVSKVLEDVKITGFTNCRNFRQGATKIAGEEVGMTKSNANKKKEPFWKRNILRDISISRKDVSKVVAWIGRWKKRQEQRERLARSKGQAEKKRIYIGNGRTETENNWKSH